MEDFRYVYRNLKDRPHRILPLVWRQREVQANMIVLDAAGKNLVYLPSQWGQQIQEKFLKSLWDRFEETIPATERAAASGDFEALRRITSFAVSDDVRRQVSRILSGYESHYSPSVELNSLLRYIRLCAGYYLPFVELEEDLSPGDSTFVRHGVEIYRHDSSLTIPERLGFYLFGRITFEVGIPFYAFESVPLASAISFHVRVRTPSGLRVKSEPTPLPMEMFADINLKDFLNYESDNVYLYLDRRDIDQLSRNRENVDKDYENRKSRIKKQLERLPPPNTARKWPSKILPWVVQSLGHSIIQRLDSERLREREASLEIKLRLTSGLSYLLTLLWLTIGAAYSYSLVGLLTPENYGLWFSAFLVVVLTIVVFSVDKKIIRELVAAHVCSTTASMIVLPVLPLVARTIRGFLA